MKRKKKPLISIIMNCYNGEEFLKSAIESKKRAKSAAKS